MMRVCLPRFPIAMVQTGNVALRLARSMFRTSWGVWGITASFEMSPPALCSSSSIRVSSSGGGVLLKSCAETMMVFPSFLASLMTLSRSGALSSMSTASASGSSVVSILMRSYSLAFQLPPSEVIRLVIMIGMLKFSFAVESISCMFSF